jgi:hypothetical protein
MGLRGTPSKTQKNANFKFPQTNLFVNQRDFPKFPQNIILHLVTLFSVSLRVYPFSELAPQKSGQKTLSIPGQKP